MDNKNGILKNKPLIIIYSLAFISVVGIIVCTILQFNSGGGNTTLNKGVSTLKNVDSSKSLKNRFILAQNFKTYSYELVDFKGNVVYSGYSSISMYNNVYILEKDNKKTYVTLTNKSLSKYKDYEFDFDHNVTSDLILLYNDKNIIILDINGVQLLKFDYSKPVQLNSIKNSYGSWYKLTTTEKTYVFSKNKIIYEANKKEYVDVIDNYVSVHVKDSKNNNVYTMYQFDKNGKQVNKIDNYGMEYKDSIYYVLTHDSTYDIYLSDGTELIKDAYHYYIKNDILLVIVDDCYVYKAGKKTGIIKDVYYDNGISIVNGAIAIKDKIDNKVRYYDIYGNKLSNLALYDNNYGFVYANYINGYLYYVDPNNSNKASIIDTKTGQTVMDNLDYFEINNDFLDRTNGEYFIVANDKGEVAIYDKNLNIIIDYQKGYYDFFEHYNSEIYEDAKRDKIYFVGEDKVICYDVNNKLKKLFKMDGKYYKSFGMFYLMLRNTYSDTSYYDIETGKLLYKN